MKTALTFFISVSFVSKIYGQTSENIYPQAQITFKSIPKQSALKEKVLILTNNDDYLTEQVIEYLSKVKKLEKIKIMNEEDYSSLPKDERIYAICDDEIISIINLFREKQ
jgi:hypothetical protein